MSASANPWKGSVTSVKTREDDDSGWLARFHEGERRVMADCYQTHFEAVAAAVSSVLREASDREAVVHDVFLRLIDRPQMRAQFTGGSLAAWLKTIARNAAIDHVRRTRREVALEEVPVASSTRDAEELEYQNFVRTFKETLAPKWHSVFDARFVMQLSQREAAKKIGVRRTTLVYREHQIRLALRKFAKGVYP